VLAPHGEALHRAYGIGANEVAAGIQQIAHSMMQGHDEAFAVLREGQSRLSALVEQGVEEEQAARILRAEDPGIFERGQAAIVDMFRGGICNLSRKTSLPEALLVDLAFERGGNGEFFAPGDFCGTPYRTLPARVRPAVKLDDGYYATDVAFIRDSAYRAIQWGLRERLPDYRQAWNTNQQRMSEDAFELICSSQLRGAQVFKEVYYQHPETGRWVENDVLVLIDDVLIQLEAKAGAMPMHNPATNFTNHVRGVKQLVTAAYEQSKRFFEYAASAERVPLFRLNEGNYEEVLRLRLADYRVCIPVGLTVESFAPFSTMCKELPGIEPILGKHPFVSLSIDDLFVVTKVLPGAGEFFHYLSVRQQAAGIRRAMVFDELDHLGFYIKKNRFDWDLIELKRGGDELLTTGYSDVIDRYFVDDSWADRPRPRQDGPQEFWSLCQALDEARKPGWLAAQACLLDFDGDMRTLVASKVAELSASLQRNAERWTMFDVNSEPVVLWLRREDADANLEKLAHEAEAFALMQSLPVKAFVLTYDVALSLVDAYLQVVDFPEVGSQRYAAAEARAAELRQRAQNLKPVPNHPPRLPGRNDHCWCGSGVKYKKCHLEEDKRHQVL
jgi:hypothetical protein